MDTDKFLYLKILILNIQHNALLIYTNFSQFSISPSIFMTMSGASLELFNLNRVQAIEYKQINIVIFIYLLIILQYILLMYIRL